jgi:methylated-DNA-[protein]-cysteine S-methyltransferase
MRATHTVFDSPLGELTLVARDGVLAGLYFAGHVRRPDPALFGRRTGRGFEMVIRQLEEYFRGERTGFELPLAARGSGFQQRVWGLLERIPYGQTRTYGQLAAALGNPGLAREVGWANGRNPISIIVPCHRVVGANGGLVGYAGGLERKRALLELEAAAVGGQMSLDGLA